MRQTVSGYFYQKLADKDAEIEWLNAEIEDWKENERRALLLITDLAAALALVDPANPTPDIEAAIPWIQGLPELLKRAKEATRLN